MDVTEVLFELREQCSNTAAYRLLRTRHLMPLTRLRKYAVIYTTDVGFPH